MCLSPSTSDMLSSSFRYGRWLEETYFSNRSAEYLMILLVSAAMIVVCLAIRLFKSRTEAVSAYRTPIYPSVSTTIPRLRTDIYLESKEYTRTSCHPGSYTTARALCIFPSPNLRK